MESNFCEGWAFSSLFIGKGFIELWRNSWVEDKYYAPIICVYYLYKSNVNITARKESCKAEWDHVCNLDIVHILQDVDSFFALSEKGYFEPLIY